MYRLCGISLLLASLTLGAASAPAPILPEEVAINSSAGRGEHLMVTVRLENGQLLPFMIDTGAPVTLLDKSFQGMLGERVATTTVRSLDDKQKSGIYPAPALYLGTTRLLTGSNIFTYDFKKPMGILGLDCLQNYCVQLDFKAGKLRFLKSEDLKGRDVGRAYRLLLKDDRAIIQQPRLLHKGSGSILDTGCNIDGLMSQREARNLRLPETARGGRGHKGISVLECSWSGETYTDLVFAFLKFFPAEEDVLGLRFLARHLVTLDFPRETLYLKKTSSAPQAGDTNDIYGTIFNSDIKEAAECLATLTEKAGFRGCSQKGERTIFVEAYSTSHRKSVTLASRNSQDGSTCHFRFTRKSAKSPWQFQKAWRSDHHHRTVEELRGKS